MTTITIRKPDDWHVHFRDGAMLRTVVPFTASQFGRAIVMPNLVPPVIDTAMAAAYRERILAAVPDGADFTPLMTVYLTETTDPADLAAGWRDGFVRAVKLYPAHATTNSHYGITDWRKAAPVFETMQKIGMPLLVHGEVTDPDIDIFDREAVFLERSLTPMLAAFPALKVVLEHATTEEAVDFVMASNGSLGSTITPQHLMLNRNAMLVGGIRPHFYCLPILKRSRHQAALRRAATSGHKSFFLGTDSAPHMANLKEAACGCAGVFSAPSALACYAQVFAEGGALEHFEAFASLNGPAFYGMPPNEERVVVSTMSATGLPPVAVEGGGELVVFEPL